MPKESGHFRAQWRRGSVDQQRRRALLALSTAGASLASSGALAQAACLLTEEAGEGPFYFDPALLRADIVDGSPGLPLDIELQITRASDCATLAAARVDVWQANGLGLYSGYANQGGVGDVPVEPAIDQTFLRGTQLTDGDGRVRFRTIFPSWYGGRTPHVHFKVWLDLQEVVASQVFFPDATSTYVFENFDPYRAHVAKRTTFNDNDPLHQGVLCEVTRQDAAGVAARVVIAVAEPA